jgi:hypothetical protein
VRTVRQKVNAMERSSDGSVDLLADALEMVEMFLEL